MFTLNERIERIREKYALPEEKSNIKPKDFIFLIIGIFIKEIIGCLLNTFDSKKRNIGNLFSTHPFTDDIFWFLILKFILGILIIIYFICKYSESFELWYIFIFWLFTVGNSITNTFKNLGNIWEALSSLVQLGNLFLCIVFLFRIDSANLDSLKLMFYDDLVWDDFSKRYIISPYSKISSKKIEHLICTTLAVVLGAMWSYALIGYLVKAIFNTSDETTKNQKDLEEHAKTHFFTVLLSSVVLAPLLEELVFRRCLMKIGGMGKLAAGFSIFIFGLMHLRNENLIKLLPYCVPATFFVGTYYVTRNIWHTIFAHSLFNVIAFASSIGFR
ncbi:hypothetical protein A6V39_02625 [Candidatus Mycoplasma haematobovis]|uniref:CAAX prenyl protease 2/Lysostaphin resistance protein A-like domain-containing protein n=1 Tax=Candidatus Mycoplasma haematobovis TaxID=432608 RepID=A0A1A9QF36_9MOLU|nr:CPBP family intramembrane glutamic endopeptidase [Candidatus Mycoplasma haematobovis]OAL10310.1 hypothetical protein A6V39_02625 [Candidatus Mycoplasma haematobovis]